MKSWLSLACAALFACGAAAHAQGYAFAFHVDTGDVALDAHFHEFDRLPVVYHEPFVEHVVYTYGAPRPLVEELIVERRYPPSYVYSVAATSKATGRSFDDVLAAHDRSRGEGWGAIARDLGIKPGSAEFHRLKDQVGSGTSSWKAKRDKGPPTHAATQRGPKAGTGTGRGNVKGKGKGKGKGKAKGRSKN